MSAYKVFCLGMFKTGTTSFGMAMAQAGLRSFTGPWVPDGDDFESWSFDKSKFLESYSDSLTILIDQFDSFNDYPFMFIYSWLADTYPDAIFVLLERDARLVAKSDRLMWERFGCPFWQLPPLSRFINRYLSHRDSVIEFFAHRPELVFKRCSISNPDDLQHLGSITGLEVKRDWPHLNKDPSDRLLYLKIRIRNTYYWARSFFKLTLLKKND